MSLARKYSPKRFEDFWGQPVAVALLSKLALRATEPRHLLFQGDWGAGKTTLALVHHKALNCLNLTATGSPCNFCAHCEDPVGHGFHEYDVPANGGDIGQIRQWLLERHRCPTGHPIRTIFFDEAHALTGPAMEALLDEIDHAKPGVSFCFATTDHWKLKPALTSRLITVEVRALPAPDAVAFLEQVAKQEGIAFERDALNLLAKVKKGHPRDLLIGLDQVAVLGKVTVDSVRQSFGLDQMLPLVDYFTGLANGAVSQQAIAMDGWREDLPTKTEWIQTFLTSLYYRDILGLDIVIDPVADSIQNGRAAIIDRFCARLGLHDARDLVPYWEIMLSFWLLPQSASHSALQLRVALFEDLTNRKLQAAVIPAKNTEIELKASIRVKAPAGLPAERVFQESAGGVDAGLTFLCSMDVHMIINRASSFTQHHGRLFNAAFKFFPSAQARGTESEAVREIRQFCTALSELKNWGEGPFASIAVIERDADGVMARVVAHIPYLMDPEGSPDRFTQIDQWADAWRPEAELSSQPFIEASAASGPRDLRFHWGNVLDLCAGVSEPDAEPEATHPDSLRTELKIPRAKWRTPGPVWGQILHFAGVLSTEAVQRACELRMPFLSAIDAQAWNWITQGWELNEHPDRQKALQSRRKQFEDMALIWRDDHIRCEQERRGLVEQWPDHPMRRQRTWHGWWAEGT